MTLADFLAAVYGQSWRLDAACRGVDSEVFFPARGDREAETAAKTICAQCPVIRECLDFALDNREPLGIWAGTSARERGRLLERRLTIRTGNHGRRRRRAG